MKHTAAHMPSSWLSCRSEPGNALVGTFLGLTEANSDSGSPLAPIIHEMTGGCPGSID